MYPSLSMDSSVGCLNSSSPPSSVLNLCEFFTPAVALSQAHDGSGIPSGKDENCGQTQAKQRAARGARAAAAINSGFCPILKSDSTVAISSRQFQAPRDIHPHRRGFPPPVLSGIGGFFFYASRHEVMS